MANTWQKPGFWVLHVGVRGIITFFIAKSWQAKVDHCCVLNNSQKWWQRKWLSLVNAGLCQDSVYTSEEVEDEQALKLTLDTAAIGMKC